MVARRRTVNDMVAIAAVEQRASNLPQKLSEEERASIIAEALEKPPESIEDRLYSLEKLRAETLAVRELAEESWRRLADSEVMFLQRELDQAEADLHAFARLYLDGPAEAKLKEFRVSAFEMLAKRVAEVQVVKLEVAACATESDDRLLRLAYRLELEREQLGRLVSEFARAQRFAQRVRQMASGLISFLAEVAGAEEQSSSPAAQVVGKALGSLLELRSEAGDFLFCANVCEGLA